MNLQPDEEYPAQWSFVPRNWQQVPLLGHGCYWWGLINSFWKSWEVVAKRHYASQCWRSSGIEDNLGEWCKLESQEKVWVNWFYPNSLFGHLHREIWSNKLAGHEFHQRSIMPDPKSNQMLAYQATDTWKAKICTWIFQTGSWPPISLSQIGHRLRGPWL